MTKMVFLHEVNDTPFSSVREKPWSMILFGPIHVGLSTTFCHQCEADSLVRSYHAERAALLQEDSAEKETEHKSFMASDALDLALQLLSAPCWVTGSPLVLKDLRIHPPEHIKEFLKRLSPLLYLPMAPQRLIAKVLHSVCPNCAHPLAKRTQQPHFSTPILDADGLFDLTPVAVIGQL